MSKTIDLSLDEICPYIRKVGKQEGMSWRKRFRRIYDHEFLYCTEGRAHIVLRDKEYDIIPGTLILVKPDIIHSFWKAEGESTEIIWVHFDFLYRKDVYELEQHVRNNYESLFYEALPQNDLIRPDPIFENGIVFPESLQVEQFSLLDELFHKLLFHFKSRKMFWQLECKALLIQVIKTVISQIAENNRMFGIGREKAILNLAVGYINKNYYRRLMLQEISNSIGINEDYLGRVFKRDTGMTVIEFINRLRIAKARELMQYSDLTISDIAEMVGFNDLFYFSKVVKKYEGIPPSELRYKTQKQ